MKRFSQIGRNGLARTASIVLVALTLAGCGAADRLSQIGAPPPLTPITDPSTSPGYRPVSMPMPAPELVSYQPNSLWQSGARAFFRDQRASRVGDILTVNINITDSAKVDNKTSRSRSNSEDTGLDNFFGLEAELGKVLPDAVDPTSLTKLDSAAKSQGEGSVDRAEEIELTLAAVVTQVMPNGNLVIEGRQEVRVNFEVRDLILTGVVRPEDISATNTIEHKQIAEARISYGGRGQITDVQQPRYGQQVLDVILPF